MFQLDEILRKHLTQDRSIIPISGGVNTNRKCAAAFSLIVEETLRRVIQARSCVGSCIHLIILVSGQIKLPACRPHDCTTF